MMPRIFFPSFAPARTGPNAANHHLWLNNGSWFVAVQVNPTPATSERLRMSLGARDVLMARARRDVVLAWLERQGCLARPATRAAAAHRRSWPAWEQCTEHAWLAGLARANKIPGGKHGD